MCGKYFKLKIVFVKSVGTKPKNSAHYFVGYKTDFARYEKGCAQFKAGQSMSHGNILASASIEVSARGNYVGELVECCTLGAEVFLTWLPGDPLARQIATAAAIARAGFHPVPHVAARQFASEAELDEFLSRAAGEAAVTRVLLIAGDQQQVRGPFDASLKVLETGLLQKHGIQLVYVAGHPEGHPRVARDIMDEALKAKLLWGRHNGVAMRVVTQFCFEAEPVIEWLRRFESAFDEPVRIGLAGPANPATLLKFAMRCGVGNSVRALQSQMGRFTRLLTETAPDAIVDDLRRASAERRIRAVPGFHIFPFGGIRAAMRWIEARKG
jgi:methylenetetrahydrofolate reductase (NADPH)